MTDIPTLYRIADVDPGDIINLPFEVPDQDMVEVYADGALVSSAHYSWTGAQQITAGATFPVNALTSVYRVSDVQAYSDAFLQPTSGFFDAGAHNSMVGRVFQALQEHRDLLTAVPTLEDMVASQTGIEQAISTLAWETPKGYGAVGNGVANDTASVLAAWNAARSGQGGTYIALDGLYSTPGSFPIQGNYIEPTFMRFTKATRLALFDGSEGTPSTESDDPVFWTQKHVAYDNAGDPNAQMVSVVHDVLVYGSGVSGSADVEGTWNALIGNTVLLGQNLGTEAAPDYDLVGSAIGVQGIARSEKPAGITTGLWGYALTPVMGATEFAAYTAMSYPSVGIEVNIEVRTPDAGYKPNFSGAGVTAGFLGYNYRTQGDGVRDWSFGQVFSGSPDDGNFASTDVNNWSGFYVGTRYDFIKKHGIEFGSYFKTGSYGIRFPDAYSGSQEPSAAIHLGNSKLQMGQYLGAGWNNGDFWHSGGLLFFRYGGATGLVLNQRSSVLTTQGSTYVAFTPAGAAEQFRIGYVASAVNYLGVFAATAGADSALVALGSNTDRGIELRTAGNGRVWIGPYSSHADASITGYIEVKDSTGTLRKVATIT